MNLTKLKEAYDNQSLSKTEFIDEMHKTHQCLYEYADYLPRTGIARIEILDGRVVMTTRETGVKFICDRKDKRLPLFDIINFGIYEAANSAVMMAVIGDHDTVLDVGANVGFYTITLARQKPETKIYAFEPIPATFDYLQKNIELNAVTNARLYNFGLSDQEEQKFFYFSPEISVNASSARLNDVASARIVVCWVKRLDDFVKSEGLAVDFIKCDVEGAELLVFRGGVETLRTDRPIIMTEMHRKWSAQFHYHPNDMIGFLGGLGYQCFTAEGTDLRPFYVMEDGTQETNFFFFHVEKHQDKLARLVGPARKPDR
jgi:FkbM family methyltransferase